MEYYLAIQNNAFESVLMRWMKLEPIIQSEVSERLLLNDKTLGFLASGGDEFNPGPEMRLDRSEL